MPTSNRTSTTAFRHQLIIKKGCLVHPSFSVSLRDCRTSVIKMFFTDEQLMKSIVNFPSSPRCKWVRYRRNSIIRAYFHSVHSMKIYYRLPCAMFHRNINEFCFSQSINSVLIGFDWADTDILTYVLRTRSSTKTSKK